MRRKLFLIFILAISILTSTACRNLNTANIKVESETGYESSTEQNENKNTNTHDNSTNGADDENQKGNEEYIKETIEDSASKVMTAIKDYDMDELSRSVHPEKGIRFTPYAYVDADENLVFSVNEIKNMDNDNAKYIWGSYDGSGESIELTFSDYYKKFIYDEDFINAKEIGYNRTLGKGNSLNNSFEFYKNSIIVEYYFPGIDPKYEGIDWRSLRLVFEKMNDTWYVVGIIHDQWTI